MRSTETYISLPSVLSLVVPAGFFSALPYQNPILYAPQFANATLIAEMEQAASNNSTATHAARLLSRAVIDGKEHKASEHAMEVAAQVIAVSDKTRGLILSLSRGISVILFIL